MGIATSHTISGFLRSDGSTVRTITMARVAEITNGFVLRETLTTAPNQSLAQQVTYKSYEVRTKSGEITRHSISEWRWPYEFSTAPGILAGTVTLNRTGLHVPANCPQFVRNDIRRQLSDMATSTGGTIGLLLVYGPLVSADYAY